jgi:hypothetical protein
MSDNEVESATRTIAASAEDIWRVITDPAGHVAIDSSGMLMTADDAKPVSAVGEQFVIHMDREALGDMPLGTYDVVNVVTRFEPYTWFEWAVGGMGIDRIGHLYGYRLAPGAEGTTEVTSYCDWSGVSDEWKQSGFFPVIKSTTLRATLGILERVVRAG